MVRFLTATIDLVRRADAARDARDWALAAQLYEAHLGRVPDDWPIWVQLGHARKESGDLDAAEAAYRQALSLAPDDGDVHLQFGHLMKLRRRRDQAIEHYARALEIDPGQDDALRELSFLGEGRQAREILQRAARAGAGWTYIDISDLVFYLRHHPRVSGIQRVQAELLRHFIRSQDAYRYTLMNAGGEISVLDTAEVKVLLDMLDRTDLTLPDLIQQGDLMARTSRPPEFADGETYVLLGAFWLFPAVPQAMRHLKRQGLRIAAYVYDLIPITHPEFCDETLVRSFSEAFVNLSFSLDLALAISDHTRTEVERMFAQLGVSVPVVAVPLAQELRPPRRDIEPARWLRGKRLDEPFVLCVCTIEIRKNHLLLFQIWRRLHRLHGDALPRLVFVGRAGWRVRDLMDQIEATRHVSGRIVILNDVSDGELATLYENCLFTIFPSLVEGWGLPVGESLVHGKPCVAARSSSIPEVGGDFAAYFDPLSAREASAVIERMLFDGPWREAAAERIRREFKPRLWEEVAQAFAAALASAGREGPRRDPRHLVPILEPGRTYRIGNGGLDTADPNALRERRIALVCGTDWHPVEAFGAWARNGTAEIEFRAPPSVTGSIVVYVTVVLPPWAGPCRVRALIDGRAAEAADIQISGSMRSDMAFETAPDADGIVRFWLETVGEIGRHDQDPRSLHVGLLQLEYVPGSDALARLRALERAVFGRR